MSDINQFPDPALVAPKPWVRIVLDALEPYQGRILGLAELYALVKAHPEYAQRVAGNEEPRGRLRATCYYMRDRGLLHLEGRGRWRVPGTPKV
ncbi:MAG: hypothetical protein M5U28_21395 [Sandaracinaceae bacterium]|nr:hypothetical protein [Sandaracinaceae bacterium]